jgi:hypothetical protein
MKQSRSTARNEAVKQDMEMDEGMKGRTHALQNVAGVVIKTDRGTDAFGVA